MQRLFAFAHMLKQLLQSLKRKIYVMNEILILLFGVEGKQKPKS